MKKGTRLLVEHASFVIPVVARLRLVVNLPSAAGLRPLVLLHLDFCGEPHRAPLQAPEARLGVGERMLAWLMPFKAPPTMHSAGPLLVFTMIVFW